MSLIELECGGARATIAPETGGRLQQLWMRDGRSWLPLLYAPGPKSEPTNRMLGSSFLMSPWPNRIDDGRFTFRGRMYDVPVNADSHALHGRTLFHPWTVVRQTRTSCSMTVTLDDGWPFAGHATQTITVRHDGIDQRAEVHAHGRPFPAGVGWHPWFRRDLRPGHDVRVRVDADQVYETAGMIPTGWLQRVDRERDLRAYPAVGARQLDTCYRHPRGDLRLHWGDLELTLSSSRNVRHAVVYTTQHAVAVEPQTCAIDAFNLDSQGIAGTGTIIVEPGRPLVAWTRWRWRTAAPCSPR